MTRAFGPVPKPAARAKGHRRPLRSRSAKAERVYAGDEMAEDGPVEGRRAFVARLLLAHPTCQMGDRIQAWCAASPRPADRSFRCDRRSVEVHEVLRRSAGGNVVDDANAIATCRSCHRWVHGHPLVARGLGLLASRYSVT